MFGQSRAGVPTIDTIKTGSFTGYVFHDPSGQPVMIQTNSSVTCLYMFDPLTNPVLLATDFNVTSYAMRYDPYGAATRTDTGGNNGGWALNPYQFSQGLYDRVTGELKFGHRWYDPAAGSWTQQDALNAPLDPGNANRYAYAGDDPINLHDPTGAYGWDDLYSDASSVSSTTGVGAGAGAAIGCVATSRLDVAAAPLLVVL